MATELDILSAALSVAGGQTVEAITEDIGLALRAADGIFVDLSGPSRQLASFMVGQSGAGVLLPVVAEIHQGLMGVIGPGMQAMFPKVGYRGKVYSWENCSKDPRALLWYLISCASADSDRLMRASTGGYGLHHLDGPRVYGNDATVPELLAAVTSIGTIIAIVSASGAADILTGGAATALTLPEAAALVCAIIVLIIAVVGLIGGAIDWWKSQQPPAPDPAPSHPQTGAETPVPGGPGVAGDSGPGLLLVLAILAYLAMEA